MPITARFISIAEHLLFVALMLPTVVLVAAAAVSLAYPEARAAGHAPIETAAACEPRIAPERPYFP